MFSGSVSWAWLPLSLLFGSPWIVAIVFYWWRRPRDGALPMSMADQVRQWLWPP